MEMSNETQYDDSDAEMQNKKDVGYGPAEEGEQCLGCKFFKEPDRCQKVRGEISPTGGCDLWESPNSIDGIEFGDSEEIEKFLFDPVEDL